MPDFTPWWQQLQSLAGHRHGGAGAALPYDHVLLIFGEYLHDLTTGEKQPLSGEDDGALARSAAALVGRLPGESAGRHRGRWLPRLSVHRKMPAVLLLLPPGEWVVTTVTLPGVAPESVASAMQLQAPTLLPGREDRLALAVNPGRDPEALSEVGLWIPQSRLESLYRAFEREGVFLTSVMPRTVAMAAGHEECHVLDSDARGQTLLHWKNGALRSWQRVSHRDLEQPVFREQWQALHSRIPQGSLLELQAGREDACRMPPSAARPYRLPPPGAIALTRQQRIRQRYALGGLAAAAVVLLAAMPFLWQSVQLAILESRLAEATEAAAGARRSQAAVRNFETQWGVLTEFPDQQPREVLVSLQEVINPNVLDALELREGYINIEGQSQDPQRLLQELESHPLFTEVDFASATSNNRYSIDLRLTSVDFPAYYDWYFPERR